MIGVKTSDMSNESLIKALSDQMGVVKKTEEQLAKVDASTGSFLCATIEDAPEELLRDAIESFEAESTMCKAQAEATRLQSSAKNFTKKATYAWFASQAIRYYLANREPKTETLKED